MSDLPDQEEIKEWVKISSADTGAPLVTVSAVQGNLSAKRTVKCASKLLEGKLDWDVEGALRSARRDTRRNLARLRKALAVLIQEDS